MGISGGIDSALTSTLCAQTGLPTLCIEMPIHQAESHVNRANEHIDQLKNRFPNVFNERADLTPIFETFKNQVPSSENEAVLNLSLANTRARLRMTTLYYFAGLNGFLVAGTGNKVEDFGVGFFTKYGDGGVWATFNSGTGNGSNQYQYTVNGTTWLAYTPGQVIPVPINRDIEIRGRRVASAPSCNTTAWSTLAFWPRNTIVGPIKSN